MRKMIGIAAVTLMSFIGAEAWATQILPLTADDLSKDAELVFVGTCVSRDFKPGDIPYTEYTFKIDSAVKGNLQPGAPLVFKQWGGAPGIVSKGVPSPRLVGMPVYEVGQNYMLFLGSESKAGLRFPVGGGQGVFHITKSAGAATVKNEMNNRFLYPNPAAASAKGVGAKAIRSAGSVGGDLKLNDLIQTVRKTGVQP